MLPITDARIDPETAQPVVNDPSQPAQPTSNERSLLIVMMLAVSNSVLDPLIYGKSSNPFLHVLYRVFQVVLWFERFHRIAAIVYEIDERQRQHRSVQRIN